MYRRVTNFQFSSKKSAIHVHWPSPSYDCVCSVQRPPWLICLMTCHRCAGVVRQRNGLSRMPLSPSIKDDVWSDVGNSHKMKRTEWSIVLLSPRQNAHQRVTKQVSISARRCRPASHLGSLLGLDLEDLRLESHDFLFSKLDSTWNLCDFKSRLEPIFMWINCQCYD